MFRKCHGERPSLYLRDIGEPGVDESLPRCVGTDVARPFLQRLALGYIARDLDSKSAGDNAFSELGESLATFNHFGRSVGRRSGDQEIGERLKGKRTCPDRGEVIQSSN